MFYQVMHRQPESPLLLLCHREGGGLVANILREEVKVINIGIKEFMQALDEQHVPLVHVDWKPPTEEDEEIESLLDSLL